MDSLFPTETTNSREGCSRDCAHCRAVSGVDVDSDDDDDPWFNAIVKYITFFFFS